MYHVYLELLINQQHSVCGLLTENFSKVISRGYEMITNKSADFAFKSCNSDNSNQHIRVLHVDDDEDFLYMSKIFLEKFGKEKIIVDSVKDPKRTIKKLKKNKYDVIISDYYIPQEKDCIELLDGIRNAGITVPFIVLTGTASKEDVLNGLNSGADCVIMKGIDISAQFTELVSTINKLIYQK